MCAHTHAHRFPLSFCMLKTEQHSNLSQIQKAKDYIEQSLWRRKDTEERDALTYSIRCKIKAA